MPKNGKLLDTDVPSRTTDAEPRGSSGWRHMSNRYSQKPGRLTDGIREAPERDVRNPRLRDRNR